MHETILALIDAQLDRLTQARALLTESFPAPKKGAAVLERQAPPVREVAPSVRSKPRAARPAKSSTAATAFPFSAAEEQARTTHEGKSTHPEPVAVQNDDALHPRVEESSGAGKPHPPQNGDAMPSPE